LQETKATISSFSTHRGTSTMTATFPIQPSARFAGGSCAPVKRPKEFACFSYDDDHNFHLGDSGLK
jgi:RAT1-interacting protein